MSALPRLLRAALLLLPAMAGAADYQYCSTCHGGTGNGNAAIQAPSLVGIEDWYLAAQLKAYRERHRGREWTADAAGTEMRTVAREIDASQSADITRHVANFRFEPQPPLVAGDAKQGSRLYAQYCASCHGARGEGLAALQAPGLSRLNDWYVVASYRKYANGTRGAEGSPVAAVTMRAAATAVPDLRIEHIARYLHSLQPRAARSTP